MKEYISDNLKEKRSWRELFRRGMCLLLAIIMVLPAGGGVFAADVDVALVNEAFIAIDKAHKTDIAQFRSAIWWAKDGGTKGEEHPIYKEDARTTAFFLSALMEKLKITHTLKANDENDADGIYTVTATVLGKEYEITIEGLTGNNWGFNGNPTMDDVIPKDSEAEKLQFQYEIDKLLDEIIATDGLEKRLIKLQEEITDPAATTDPKHAKVTAEKLKEISDKLVVYGNEVKTYGDKIINITLKAIGVAGLEFNKIDKKISELQIIVDDIEDKVIKRGNELPGEINEETKAKLQEEVDEIIISIGEIVTNLVTIENDLKTSLDLIELEKIKVKIDAYEREVTSHENRVKAIKELASEVHPDFKTIEDNISELKTKLESVKTTLGEEIAKERKNDAELKIRKAEKDKTNADVTEAKKAVALIEDNNKSGFEERIAYVEQVIKAIAAVDKAVKSKKADDYGVADALVNGDLGLKDDINEPPRDVKDGLNAKLEEVKVIIDADAKKVSLAEAAKAVTAAETALNKYADGNGDADLLDRALKNAVDKINEALKNDVPHNTGDLYVLIIKLGVDVTGTNPAKATKAAGKGFHLRAEKIAEVITAIEIKEAKILGKIDLTGLKSVSKDSLSEVVKDRIQYLGKGLNTRIDDIYKVIDVIAGFDATNIRTLADVKAARAVVTKLSKKFELTKAILNAEITKQEEEIKSNEPKTSVEAIQKTYEAVIGKTAATSTEIAAIIKTAKTLIGKETDNIEKIKLTVVINAIDTAQKAKEAVALAEATKLRKDFDKADSLVKSISEDNLEYIMGGSENLTGLKSNLNNKLAPLLKIINLAEATAAVVKAENSLNQKDYDLAFTAIGKVEGDITKPDTDKGKLKQKLDIVKSVIDATNALTKAVSAVGEAAKSSKDLDNSKKITAANTAITDATNAIDAITEIDIDGKYKINKEAMKATVKDLEDVYIPAIKAVDKLSQVQQGKTIDGEDGKYKDYDSALTTAKIAVGKVTDSKVRSDLEAGIAAIEVRRNVAGSINNAEEKLVAAEMMLNNLLLKDNKNSEGLYKPVSELGDFETEIEEIKKAITDADAEIKKVKDKRATEFKNRLAAVTAAKDVAILIAKAEGSVPLVKAEVDAATKALPKVKEDVVKDSEDETITIINHKKIKAYFQVRVNHLNAALVKAQQLAEAKKLTDKAYETTAEGDIKKAIEYVAKMENIDDKGKYNKGDLDSRIFGINTILDKFATEKVEKNILDAIGGLQMDLKSGAKPVGDAKKSTDVFSNLVKLADSRLGEDSLAPPAPADLIKYADKYENDILDYNTNNAAMAKAQQVWQQIAKADKSKSVSDIEMLDIEFGLLIGIVEGIGNKFIGKYYESNTDGVYTKGLLGSLQGEINRIINYKENEDEKKEEADNAILAVIATLKKYTDVKDAEGKKEAREQLPIDIGKVRTAAAKIDPSDKAAHKEYNSKIALMELYRDAINKINRAQISCTPANVKDAKAAVDKVDKAKDNGDYIFVNVVLVREIDELYERLVNEESAEKAKILVQKAWDTKSQIDWDAANNAVQMLPENNEAQEKIKEDLAARLDELKKIIGELDATDREAVTKAENALKEALKLIYESKIQNIDPDEDEINEAYAKLTGRGIDGTSSGEPEFAEYYIKTAKDSTNKIVRDLDGKNALLEIIAEREHLFKVYSEEILIKEARRLIVKADASVILRNSMPKDTPEERKAWEAQTVIANGDLDSAAIAIKRINLPENFEARQRLLERLGLITKDLNTGTTTDKIAYINGLLREATKKVSEARDVFEKGDVGGNLMALLTNAKNLVGDIEIEIEMLVTSNESEQSAKDKLKELVANLRKNLTNIENGISDKDLIANAEKAIKAAEDRVKKKEYESAKVDIMEAEMNTEQISDTNAIKRNELRSKINKLKNDIAEATGGEETPPLDDQNDAKVVAKALQLYYKAKASLLQKDIDAARKYINENMVHNTTLKQWLLAKLAELEKIIVGINKPGDIEEAKRKEEEAKKKAEEARKKKYPGIDDALNSKDRDKNNPDAKWGKENEFKKK